MYEQTNVKGEIEILKQIIAHANIDKAEPENEFDTKTPVMRSYAVQFQTWRNWNLVGLIIMLLNRVLQSVKNCIWAK